MMNQHIPSSQAEPSELYEIRIQGVLNKRWTETWFHGWDIKTNSEGQTILTGLVIDQAALYGLLKTIRDLGLQLLAVNRIEKTDNESN